jgi:hypothetical protein
VKLRLRVGLATVAVVIPALALILWPRLSERERALVRATADFALARPERFYRTPVLPMAPRCPLARATNEHSS